MKKVIVILSVIVVILIGSLLIFSNKSIKTLNSNNFNSVIKKNEYSVVYLGKKSDEISDYLTAFTKLGGLKAYYTSMTYEDLNSTYNLNLTEKDKYVIFSFDSYVASMEDGLTLNRYDELLKKYLFDIIPEDERNYIVPSNTDDYIKLLKGNGYTISVFGKNDCYYCNLYLPTINQIAGDYKLDVYYLDADLYDEEGYQKIMDLDLVIPASCTTKKIETSFKKGFAKPTTIITKKGKVVGCIKGNVTREVVIEKLKEFKLVEE